MKYYSNFYKSRCTVISRDRDVVIAKVLKNTNSNFFFKLGNGVSISRNNVLRGIILELSIKFIKVLLLDAAKDIVNGSSLYPCNKVLSVNKNIPGLIYTGLGRPMGNFRPIYSNKNFN